MTFTLIVDPPPLEINADNVVLVGQTRVTLDTVVSVFKQGTTAEEIVHRYPALKLADVYGTIAFYLNHQQMVETYLAERQTQAETVRELNETRLTPMVFAIDYLPVSMNRKHAKGYRCNHWSSD